MALTKEQEVELERFEERAAIKQYEAGLSRGQAEKEAAEEVWGRRQVPRWARAAASGATPTR